MFLDFFEMKVQPFGVTPDPRFLYLGKSHREALASLYYGIQSDRGFVALIAPPGLGKPEPPQREPHPARSSHTG